MKTPSIADLNKIYDEAESIDKETFAEQRSNLLLISGVHYTKKTKAFNQQVRDNKNLSETQKLRITKNHTHKIQRHYVEKIISFAPGVAIKPQKDAELQDQKSAELHKSVWGFAKVEHRIDEKVDNWAEYFVALGAVAVKQFFDPNAGDFVGYETKPLMEGEAHVHNEMGEPQWETDEQGYPVPDTTKPKFKGAIVFEDIYDFNLLFNAGATGPDTASCWIIRKMVPTSDLEAKYAGDSEKLGYIKSAKGEAFVVFDSNRQVYDRSKNESLIREHYWPKCFEYPNGYFTISTAGGILEEGELPLGIFPICSTGFDIQPTARRSTSIHKVSRPFQAEHNRASSQMATHAITVGDDKIIYQAGTKLNPGALLPGVRGITYQGTPPTTLPGRTGDQYLPGIQANLIEWYQAVDMAEELEEKRDNQVDAWTSLSKSLKQQKKYAKYGKKFNRFLVDVCTLYLTLAKAYLSDEQLLEAIGSKEQVNVSEFRNHKKLCYEIVVEEQDETVESKFGRQLSINHALQYVGPQMKPEDIGKMLKAMPFANMDEAFGDLTLEYDNAKNDMLSLERGEYPEVDINDDHPYMIKKLTNRMKQSDFRLLRPEIQMNYKKKKSEHQQLEAYQMQMIKAAESEFIPVDGALVACDMYVPNKNPDAPAKRVRLPYTALQWLVKQLETQGQTQDELETMNNGSLAEISQQFLQQQGGQPQPPNGSNGIGVN